MDGTLDILVRLEDDKRKALIALDAAAYERAVEAQTDLLPRILPDGRAAGFAARPKLRAFAELAHVNAYLSENLLATSPAVTAVPDIQYNGDGQTRKTEARPRTFSAKA